MEASPIVAQDVVASIARRRTHPEENIGGEIPGFRQRRMGAASQGQHSERRESSRVQATSRRNGNDVERRVTRTETLIYLGELSSARMVLEGGELAPRTVATLHTLQDARRRHPVPRAPLPQEMINFQPEVPFQLDQFCSEGI